MAQSQSPRGVARCCQAVVALWLVGCLLLTFFFIFYCLQIYCPNGISPMGNSGCISQGKPAAIESRYPTYGTRSVFQCFHNPLNSGKDYRIFNVRTDVNAYVCTRGCTVTFRESTLKVGSWRKIPCRTGIEPASAACRSDALPTTFMTQLRDNGTVLLAVV